MARITYGGDDDGDGGDDDDDVEVDEINERKNTQRSLTLSSSSSPMQW